MSLLNTLGLAMPASLLGTTSGIVAKAQTPPPVALVGPSRSPAHDDENIKKMEANGQKVRYLSTPYGELALFANTAADVPAMVDKAVKGLKTVEADYAQSFLPQIKKQAEKLKPIASVLNDPKSLLASFAHPPAAAVAAEETAQNALTQVGTLEIMLHDLKGRLESAKRSLDMALADKVIAQKKEKAAALREEVERQQAFVTTGMTLVGTALQATVSVSVAVNPVSRVRAVYTPVYGAVTAVYKLFHENDLSAQAAKLEAEAGKLQSENLEGHIAQANDDITHANTISDECNIQVATIQNNFERQRARAEQAFDDHSGAAFKFKPLQDAYTVISATPAVALKTALIGFDASQAVWDLQGQFSYGYEGVVNKPVTEAMANVMNRSRTDGTRGEQDAKKLLAKIDEIRAMANEALANAKTKY